MLTSYDTPASASPDAPDQTERLPALPASVGQLPDAMRRVVEAAHDAIHTADDFLDPDTARGWVKDMTDAEIAKRGLQAVTRTERDQFDAHFSAQLRQRQDEHLSKVTSALDVLETDLQGSIEGFKTLRGIRSLLPANPGMAPSQTASVLGAEAAMNARFEAFARAATPSQLLWFYDQCRATGDVYNGALAETYVLQGCPLTVPPNGDSETNALLELRRAVHLERENRVPPAYRDAAAHVARLRARMNLWSAVLGGAPTVRVN